MGRRIAIWTLLTLGSATSSVWALTADDYVLAARAALFERTYAGLLQVEDVFGAAVGDDCCRDGGPDRELILLHAVAQTAMLFVDYNDVLVPEDFFRLAEVFGIPLDGLAFQAGETEDAHGQGDLRTLRTEMGVGASHETLREVVLPQLDVIIGNLDAIEDQPDPFIVYLLPEETGLMDDLEIDYGDVLILKGLLSAYRGLLATQCTEDGADGDTDDTCGPNVLAAVLASLVGPDEGIASLLCARDDWVAALTWCIAAAEHMAAEDSSARDDPQDDEFVYIDPDAQPYLEAYQRTLTALRSCLAAGAEAVDAGVNRRTYRLQNTDAQPLGELTLVFDLTGIEGTTGHLTLVDGTALDADWFGPLGEGRIGVSLFSGPEELEGWLEVTLDQGRGVIHDGILELWGRRSATMRGLTGQVARHTDSPARTEAPLTANAVDNALKSRNQLAPGGSSMTTEPSRFKPQSWLEGWLERPGAPLPLPSL